MGRFAASVRRRQDPTVWQEVAYRTNDFNFVETGVTSCSADSDDNFLYAQPPGRPFSRGSVDVRRGGDRRIPEQLGTSGYDEGHSVVIGGGGADIYVSGYSQGELNGQANIGAIDSVLLRLDADGGLDGNVHWGDSSFSDAFIMKFSTAGVKQ